MITAKYTLENEAGERIDLTAPAPIFLVNVEGLGITTNITYGDLENGFFHTLYEQTPQNNITGDLIYQTTAFDNYQSLVNWISKAKTLYFCYQPLETEYRRIVKLNYIVKERRTAGGWMRAGISFSPLTPWYLAKPTEIGMGGAETEISKGYFLGDEASAFSFTQDLHGYDHPWPGGGGKNKINAPDITLTSAGYIYNGQLSLSAGTYTMSLEWGGSGTPSASFAILDANGNSIVSGSHNFPYTFTISADAVSAMFYSSNAGAYSKIQIEPGSTATAWTPYENLCPITPGFTMTRDDDSELAVYAGYLDMDTQSIVETRKDVNLADYTFAKYSSSTSYYINLPDKAMGVENVLSDAFYSNLVAIASLAVGGMRGRTDATYVYIGSDKATAADFNAWIQELQPKLVYELAEPITIQLTASEFERALSILGGSFGYRYTEDLRYGGDAAGTMSATITPSGHVPAAVVLRYTGAITNPRVRLVGAETGIVYGICALNESLSDGETFELSTRYEDSHVTLIEQDGTEENLLPAVNQAYEHYFRCPTTEASVLTIESDGAFEGAATLLVYNYYRSV